MMQTIEDDRFCATLTITLTVDAAKHKHQKGKHIFPTTPFNVYTSRAGLLSLRIWSYLYIKDLPDIMFFTDHLF